MSVRGLPKLLEKALNDILDTGSVSSWNIRVDSKMCQLSIRFNMADTLADKSLNTTGIDSTNITFRKVPPSQISRDKRRMKEHQEHLEQLNSGYITSELSDTTDCAFNQFTTVSTNITPLNPQQQVDGPRDQLCSECSNEHEREDSHLGCLDADPNNSDQDYVVIPRGHNKHKLKRQCGTCNTKIGLQDNIRCCFICKQMFCENCLNDGKCCDCGLGYLHGLDTLSVYLDYG